MLLLLIALTNASDDDSREGDPGTDDRPNGDAWNVDEPHGPTHEVTLDVTEGTWTNVTVSGDRLVFDLLGDLWSLPLAGGEATRLTQGAAWDVEPQFSPDGSQIAFTSDRGGNEQIWVMKADGTEAHALTEEKEARVTDPVWDPSGDWVLARRRTVDTRSIGVTELYLWSKHGGAGVKITDKDAHPHAGEAVFLGDEIVFSTRHGRFEYNHDPVGGLWHIAKLRRSDGRELPLAQGPGSATRPTITPDGSELWFVSRDRTKTLLEAMDLHTGARRVVADWLSPDEMEGFALHQTYPRMAWAGDELVLWAQGKLWRVARNGDRAEIPFHVHGTWTLHDVQRPKNAIPDEVTARVLRWTSMNARGEIAFSAMGRVFVRAADGSVQRVSEGTGYSPAWSPDGKVLAYTSWADATGGGLHLWNGKRTDTIATGGQLVNPAWSDDGRLLVLRGAPSGSVDPDLGAARWFDVVLITPAKKGWEERTLFTVPNRGSASRAQRPWLRANRIFMMESVQGEPRTPEAGAWVSMNLEGADKRTILKIPAGTEEIVPSPDGRYLAYKSAHQLHVVPLPSWEASTIEGGVPDERVTAIVGDWIGWTADGSSVTWVQGNVFKQKSLSELFQKKDEDDDGEDDEGGGDGKGKEDDGNGDDAKKDPFEEVAVTSTPIDLRVPRHVPDRRLGLIHARVVTMRGDEVLEDATLFVDGDTIRAVGPGAPIPPDVEVWDLTGKTIIPGLVDVHAHLHYSAGDILPEAEWRYLTALDFGVTTVQDPSASTDTVFTQAEMVEAGFMKGPRVYSTGMVLYGALATMAADTPDLDAARAHVRRIKAVGGRSVKVYQQSQRERRQWYLQACREEAMLCVPEGGGDLWMNLGMVADGFHAVEHALPTAPLRQDVLGFVSGSHHGETAGTFYTPTLLVAYGGLSGEWWFYQHASPLDDERLQRHFPRRLLDSVAWRPAVSAQDGDWRHQEVARDAAALQDRGVSVTLGAHGQLQGLGAHWELWGLAGDGAMTPHEALRAATLDGARYLGLGHLIGSIEPGKKADFIVLNENPLEDIHHSTSIDFVVKNGEVWR